MTHLSEGEESFVQFMTLKGKNEWNLNLLVFIGQADVNILRLDLQKAYSQIITKCKKGNITSCNIKFLIVPDIVKKSGDLLDLCHHLCAIFVEPEKISCELPDLKDLTVNFTYDKDELITEKKFFAKQERWEF